MKEEYITAQGLQDIKKELHCLKTEKTKEIAELIRHTASFGDLKENFAYHDAKERQSFLLSRIKELENRIKNAKVIEKKQTGKVQIGSKVTVSVDGEKQEFSIVASDRVDPAKGRISYESPLGRALLNKSVGEYAEMEIDGDKTKYKISKIE